MIQVKDPSYIVSMPYYVKIVVEKINEISNEKKKFNKRKQKKIEDHINNTQR